MQFFKEENFFLRKKGIPKKKKPITKVWRCSCVVLFVFFFVGDFVGKHFCFASVIAEANSKSGWFFFSRNKAFSRSSSDSLTNEVVLDEAGSGGGALLVLACNVEDLPESQGLISCCRDDSTTIRTLCQVQHSAGVSFEFSELGHGWVLPHDQLVLREAVGRDQLTVVFAPLDCAHLGVGVDAVQACSGLGVPESDLSIR